MIRTKIFLCILLSFLLFRVNAQETLYPLLSNPGLQKHRMSESTIPLKAHMSVDEPMLLPFIDDFSEKGVYPSENRWIDNYVYINSQYAFDPVTTGVATFDALDDTGAVYEFAAQYSFVADLLTSRTIRLDSVFSPVPKALKSEDSLYFSFLFQPQGYGNAPEGSDSLVLEFITEYRSDTIIDSTVSPPETYYEHTWKRVWSSPGMPLEDFSGEYHGRPFKLVMIPVTDSVYFSKYFGFRFYNYASISDNMIPSWRSNADHWNIDYIYLNRDRSLNDTTFKDLAIRQPVPSLLKYYSAMSWKQFVADSVNQMNQQISIPYSNLDNDFLQVDQYFRITDLSGASPVYNPPLSATNIGPLADSTFRPVINYVFPVSDSVEFEVLSAITTNTLDDIIPSNDSSRYFQKFYNYMAFDDGSAEAGYGLSPAGSQLAYRFTLNAPDTLTGVKMFFNHVLNEGNHEYFTLAVWDNDNGKPGKLIYAGDYNKPRYADSLNRFQDYLIESETPLVIDGPSLTFFVGWIQKTDDNLNIGFDMNRDASDNIFYNVSSEWLNTSFTGSLMIRPMLGKVLYQPEKKLLYAPSGEILIIPNPVASGSITLSLPEQYDNHPESLGLMLEMYDVTGSRVFSGLYTRKFDVSGFSRGIYFIRVYQPAGSINLINKLVISE